MPMFTRNKEVLKRGIKIVSNEIPGSNPRLQVVLVSPHTVPGKQGTAYSKQPCPMLNSHMGYDISQPDDDL
jgi:hypothetical protein